MHECTTAELNSFADYSTTVSIYTCFMVLSPIDNAKRKKTLQALLIIISKKCFCLIP